MYLPCAVLCVFVFNIVQVKTRTLAEKVASDDSLLFWRRLNGPNCTPFTVFKVQCNQCICAADGTVSCTRMDCGDHDDDDIPFKKDQSAESSSNQNHKSSPKPSTSRKKNRRFLVKVTAPSEESSDASSSYEHHHKRVRGHKKG